MKDYLSSKEKEYLLNNPGLAPYDLTDYDTTRGINFFVSDTLMVRLLRRYLPQETVSDVLENLTQFGQICSESLNDLISAAHKEGKYGILEKYDRSGKRVDNIVYCDEQNQARKIAYDFGIVNLDYHKKWKHSFHSLHRWALAYLQNQNGEGGIACPLAMTEGLIYLLREIGTVEQQQKYLPILTDPDKGTYFMAGQYITERVGGSNVSANRTVAVKQPDGKFFLYGEKWFCSNPGDLWVTTARLDGSSTIGLFLVPRFKENGELNEHHILRTKDIIGSRGKVTAEIEYRGVEAEVLGKPSRGLVYLIQYVLKVSRIHVALGGLGMGRRALLEAQVYAGRRTAYGKRVMDYPMVMKNLLTMKTLQMGAELAVFASWQYIIDKNPIEDILVPMCKYKVSVHGSWMAREAILTLGGNGIIGDFSILPRLMNDNIINETWEGTHNILGEHTVKAFRRPSTQEIFWTESEKLVEKAKGFKELKKELHFYEQLKNELKQYMVKWSTLTEDIHNSNTLPLVDLIYRFFVMALYLREAALDLSEQKQNFVLFARAYHEIEERHISGFIKEDSVFADSKIMLELIDY